MSGSSFQDLIAVHESFLRVLLGHQDDLVAGRLDEARDSLARFAAEIRAHIRLEEEILLPIYEERAGVIAGGSVELFQGEHRRILAFLVELDPAVRDLQAGDTRGLVALLEREYMLKQLLHHHDLRERNLFFPALDRVTDAEERGRLLQDSLPPGGSAAP